MMLCAQTSNAQTPAPSQSLFPVNRAVPHDAGRSAAKTTDATDIGTPYPNTTTAIQWHTNVDGGDEDWVYSIIENDEKCLIGAGYSADASGTFRPAIFKLNNAGSLLWAKTTPTGILTPIAGSTGMSGITNGGVFTSVIKAPGDIFIAVGWVAYTTGSSSGKYMIVYEFKNDGTPAAGFSAPIAFFPSTTDITGSTAIPTSSSITSCVGSGVALDPIQNSAANLIVSGEINYQTTVAIGTATKKEFGAAFITNVNISGGTPGVPVSLATSQTFLGGNNLDNTTASVAPGGTSLASGGNVLTKIITNKTSSTTYDIYTCGYISASANDNIYTSGLNADGGSAVLLSYDKDGWLVKLQMNNATSSLSLTNQWQFNKSNVLQEGLVALNADPSYAAGTLRYHDTGPFSARNFAPKTGSGARLIENSPITEKLAAPNNLDERVSDMVLSASGNIELLLNVNMIGNTSNGVTGMFNGGNLLHSSSPSTVVKNYKEYRDCDAFLVRVNTTLYSATSFIGDNVAHFSGTDFTPSIIQDKMGRYIIGGATADTFKIGTGPNLPVNIADDGGDGENALIVCASDDYTAPDTWRRSVVPHDSRQSDNDEDCFCLFCMAPTSDDGYVVAGNNDNHPDANNKNADDWSITKFSPVNENTLPSGNAYQMYGSTTNIPATYTLPAGTTTWSGVTQYIASLIIVPSGATLNISSSTLNFASGRGVYDYYFYPSVWGGRTYGAGILVQPGGKVFVTNSTLQGINFAQTTGTGTDRNMWDGIVVQGAPTVPTLASQGYVSISGSTIKDAVYGFYVAENYRAFSNLGTISTGGFTGNTYTSTYNGYGNLGGGVVVATTDNFLDNRFGFTFQGNVGGPNASNFKGCTFNTDASGMADVCLYTDANGHNLPANTYGSSWEGRILAQDNTFTCDPSFATSVRPIGLGGSDAALNVTRSCSLIDAATGDCASGAGPGNTFTNLSTAIILAGNMVTASAGSRITYNTFNNNATACITAANLTASLQVSNNSIKVPASSIGISLAGCIGYEVALNNFDATTPGSITNSYGVIVNDGSLTNDEIIENNHFTNYNYACVALGTNGGTLNHGLQFHCNNFDANCYADIGRVSNTVSGASYPGTLANPQGSCTSSSFPGHLTTPAGNQFPDPCYLSNNDRLWADATAVTTQPDVIYNNNALGTIFDPVGCFKTAPQYVDISCTSGIITGSPSDISAACPPPATNYVIIDHSTTMGHLMGLRTAMATTDSVADSDTYRELVVECNRDIAYIARYYSFAGKYDSGGMWLEQNGLYTWALSFYLDANDSPAIQRMEGYIQGHIGQRTTAGADTTDGYDTEFATLARIAVNLYNNGQTLLDLSDGDMATIQGMAQYNSRAGYIAAFTDTMMGVGPMLWPIPLIDTTGADGAKSAQATNINNAQVLSNFIVYPNPSAGTLTIQTNSEGNFYLYNIMGQSAGVYKVRAGETIVSLSASLASGTYIGKYIPANGKDANEVRIVLDR